MFLQVSDSLHGGGGIPACIAGIQAHTQVGQKVEGSPGPYPGGKVGGSGLGGLQAHTWVWGGSPSML